MNSGVAIRTPLRTVKNRSPSYSFVTGIIRRNHLTSGLVSGWIASAPVISAAEIPPTFGYPLRFSEYNYLNAAYLLKPVIRLMAESLDQIALRAKGLGDWESARRLVEAVAERERPFLDRARELEAQRPKEQPAPARIRGTSASRW